MPDDDEGPIPMPGDDVANQDEEAMKRETGVRSLRSMFEEVLLELRYDIDKRKGEQVVITGDYVRDALALRVALAREAFDAAEAEEEDARETAAAEEAKRRKEEEVKKKREAVDEAHRLAELEDARRELAGANQVRSIHWSPYDPVGVVNADP